MASTVDEIPAEISAATADDGDEILNLVDVIAEQDALEEDARAVLGGADDSSCTYSKGYVKRQPLYSCLTCSALSGAQLAGVCFGCSLQCHDGHDLIELYTKRNFRCDCGNSRFESNFKCILNQEKDPLNEFNKYNQNFEGTYCSCHRPYPDPENDVDDEMYQCIICEDWLHARHAGIEDDEFFEFICSSCAERLSFLCVYSIQESTSIDEKIDEKPTQNGTIEEFTELESRSLSVVSKNPEKLSKGEEICIRPSGLEVPTRGPIFCSYGWRERLCRCEKCLVLYRENSCEFLLDHSDSIEAYEENAKANESASDPIERGLKILNEMDRFKQVELLQGYNSMKDELMNYLSKFSSSGKVVREEDIREFFDGLKSNKRQRSS